MTLEQILEKIKQDRGEVVLGSGRQLAGLFADYSRGQLRPQANALRTFLDCRGNERILNLQNASGPAQQTEYHRLIQEMVRDYNMQEATAADVCAAFWRVAIGTEPPILKSSPETVKEPMREMSERNLNKIDSQEFDQVSSTPPSVERGQKPKWRYNWLEGITMALGFAVLGLLLYAVFLLLKQDEYTMVVGLFFCAIGIALILGMQYGLWKRKTRSWLSHFVSDKGGALVWILFSLHFCIGGPVASIQILIGNISILPLDGFNVVLFLYAVSSWYYIFWNITAFAEAFREIKAQKRGGKK